MTGKDFSGKILFYGDEVITLSSPPGLRHLVKGRIEKIMPKKVLVKTEGRRYSLERYQTDCYKI